MFKRAVFAGTALACWATVMPAQAQDPPPRQEPPRQERRDDRQDRRDDRRDDRQDRRDDRRESVPPAQGGVEQRTGGQQQAYRVKNVIGTKVSIQGNLANRMACVRQSAPDGFRLLANFVQHMCSLLRARMFFHQLLLFVQMS